MSLRGFLAIVFTQLVMGGIVVGAEVAEPSEVLASVSFNRDVRPILAKHCFACHGPDEEAREAELRLDTEEGAHRDLGGYRAVEAGRSADSEIIIRVTSDDQELRMPPADSHPPLSREEVGILRRWIQSSGSYDPHWAFVRPARPLIPDVELVSWCRTPIDRFVLARMQQAGLKPSKRAERPQLIRRLYLDLIGTTPSPEDVIRFLNDERPDAVERLVDRLLSEPGYAERFTRPWLDLARYADTNGYEKDRPRTIWPYRDWVIDAIADDMPFDQFSIEQLAGDMLPSATERQKISTGFHRNTMLNEEGGIDPLEYRFHALVDRVATTGTVWMGMTTGCAQCHTHKYDPITHTDYYALMAMLNNADEPELAVANSAIDQQRRRIQEQMDSEIRRLVDEFLPTHQQFVDRVDLVTGRLDSEASTTTPIQDDFARHVLQTMRQTASWTTIVPDDMTSTMPKLSLQSDDSILASGDVTKRDVYRFSFNLSEGQRPITAIRLEVLPHDSLPAGGPGMAFYEGRRGDFFLSEWMIEVDGASVELVDLSHSYGKISVGSGNADAANVADGEGSTGWSTSGAEGEANRLIANFAEPITVNAASKEETTLTMSLVFERHFAAALGHFRFSVSSSPAPVESNDLPLDLDRRLHRTRASPRWMDRDLFAGLQRHFVRTASSMAKHRRGWLMIQNSMPESIRTLIMKPRSRDDRRVTLRHHRGEYLQGRERVSPGIPSYFQSGSGRLPTDRLEFARWLVSADNPLVGRVTVNRAWRIFFGHGLVRTAGDFGTQSEPPSHPNLLDWMAEDWRAHGWSMKRMHRQIVLSATYLQEVGRPPSSDPDNRLLSTFPHRRLSAEQIRDAVLSASGLLTRTMGGPSVHPPQPARVTGMAYGSPKWETSKGADRYRRSLYTFSKRTAPFAASVVFDAPTGELCLARRDRSTTPLQALTLMNDAMFVEIAEALAEDVCRRHTGSSPEQIATEIFMRLLSRRPSGDELRAVMNFFDSRSEHAKPWMLVARALMNTDEAITIP
ncbi:MAG: PSD1 and planctomycete cytochrome C domain-containing protein [Planctomycetota bacterium]